MSTYTQIIYQIVFSTKYREATLINKNRKELFKYIWGVLENKKCHLYQIGGVEDHIHIVTHLHPSVALSSLIKDIKLASTENIKERNLFPKFNGWQDGYGALTFGTRAMPDVLSYVRNQKEHHRQQTTRAPFERMTEESDGVQIVPDDLAAGR